MTTPKELLLTSVREKISRQMDMVYLSEIPDNVLAALDCARNATNDRDTQFHIEAALRKAEMHYLASWNKGRRPKDAPQSEPMSEETKAELKERKAKARAEKPPKPPRVPQEPKKPVHQDAAAQKARMMKYPWLVEGTFIQDPHKAGGTLVDIKCVKCGGNRQIHLSDAFQVKLCQPCRDK